MAIRNIREMGEEVLTKVSKEVKEVTDRTRILIDDMIETLYDAGGVGLAAPQVGVLKRIVIIDIWEEEENHPVLVMINPKIIEQKGEESGNEGCLSVPGKVGIVTRPEYVRFTYFDEDMVPHEEEATGLFARCVCHELEHLDGHLYVEKVEGALMDATQEEE